MSDKPENRVYRGLDTRPHGERLLVMNSGNGPTEREEAQILYELKPEAQFWWGYVGTAADRTAAAILEDALGDMPLAEELHTPLGSDLRLAFTQDFLAYFHDKKEFWLSARAVVRWVRGYLHEIASD